MQAGKAGFTLIEMSIVLVIIGLIVGGVLVGQDLIRAAYVRAQISQIEKFNTAVNTFYGKYQALPGDMNATTASANGFATRPGTAGLGDGNGIIEGNAFGGNRGVYETQGETLMFWSDLTYANGMNINLIEGSFQTATFAGNYTATGTQLNQYFPAAKIGRGNYIYAWSGGWGTNMLNYDGRNYYGLSAITAIEEGYVMPSNPGLTVAEAYRIDSKMDDGLPQSGRVMAIYIDWFGWGGNATRWAAGPTNATGAYDSSTQGPTTNPTPGTVNTCYDNNGTNGAGQTYSMEINGGAGLNCALSFMMQGGD
jgi:prepilin-type N-terminal cleavage/methylation domain-containing protein